MPLNTKDIHPHVITAECRLPCLRGIVWGPTLAAVGCQLRDDARPHGTLAWLAEWHQQGRLIEIGNVGVKGVAQIGRALEDAGIIPAAPDRQPAAAPQESPEPGSGHDPARPETPPDRSHGRPGGKEIPAPDNGRLLRLSEVAEMLRVAPKTVTRWSTEGSSPQCELPAVTAGTRKPTSGRCSIRREPGRQRARMPCPEPDAAAGA
jgi:hypothetical protein